jgi:undecaprenyl diphosphate synthase
METQNIPRHIAIIMDGNGRWGTGRGLPRSAGHARGAQALRKIVEHCVKIKLKTLTVYAFSSENWARPEEEVSALMRIFDRHMDDFLTKLAKKDVEVRFIGDASVFEKRNPAMLSKMKDIEEKTFGKTMKLNIAMNYGGRGELVRAANRAFEKSAGSAITEEMLEAELYTGGQEDPDLVIRTAGEKRLSNFLLWQCAYSEFWFTDILWPDFTKKALDEAMLDFSKRKRRYGGT